MNCVFSVGNMIGFSTLALKMDPLLTIALHVEATMQPTKSKLTIKAETLNTKLKSCCKAKASQCSGVHQASL